MSLFNKKTGDYTKPNDQIGKWHDSLVGPVVRQLGGDDQNGLISSIASPPTHPHLSLTTKFIVQDMENLVAGRGDRIETDFVLGYLKACGVEPGKIRNMPHNSRVKFHNEIVKNLRASLVGRDLMSTVEMLLVGKDIDHCLWLTGNNNRIATTCGAVRAALRMPVEEFMALPEAKKLRVTARASQRLLQQQRAKAEDKESLAARTRLHMSLHVWSQSKLVVERPSGSSLHHLLDYDASCTDGTFAKNMGDDGCQTIIVEHDWSGAVPPTALGEWQLPFALVCWEFRISGVRVLAFTDCIDEKHPRLWLTYGRDNHWVSDDYNYIIGDGLMLRQKSFPERKDQVEFLPVARLVHACIRSACIMMDAQIVRHEPVRVSQKLNEKRVQERKAPLRDHYVVRLIHGGRKAHHRARSAGASVGGARAPQRGHWRIGTWVHYDDPDSGSVQYANDGGFIVSKSWRRWHFAGDPNNIIHKSYRI